MYKVDYIILISRPSVFLNQFTPNSAWSLEGKLKKNVKYRDWIEFFLFLIILKDTSQNVDDEHFDDIGEKMSMLTITFHFRRRTLFFSFNFILPSLVLTVCSIFGFILPPDSGEKISLRKKLSIK